MIKIIVGSAILLAAGIVWLRVQWARSKNSNTSQKIVADLQSSKYVIESYADSLSIMIRTKTILQPLNPTVVREYLHSLIGKKPLNKFMIRYGDMNENAKGIVIGEGAVKDSIQMPGQNKEIDVFYPCWLYIEMNENGTEVSFKSTFPENKDHHYLLEELSGEIYDQCMKRGEAR
jgi:hypothetical protein